MNKEFVTYEQALALKELGFESPYPIGGYQGGKVFYYEKGELYYDGRPMYSSDAHSGQLLAPLYQQAFKWFREKYGLYIDMFVDDNKTFGFMITHFTSEGRVDSPVKYNHITYEEAEQACLDKLIEICKTK